MKKCYDGHAVDFTTNTVTVTKKFMMNASQWGSAENNLMKEFQAYGLRIVLETRKPRTPKKTDKSKPALLTYAMMEAYIRMLDVADEMLSEFEAVREAAKSRRNRQQYVNDWFRKTFPRYDAIPELDDDNRIVYNPNASLST